MRFWPQRICSVSKYKKLSLDYYNRWDEAKHSGSFWQLGKPAIYIFYGNNRNVTSHTRNGFTIKYTRVQQQNGSSDFGLFAIANASAICHGDHPSNLNYNQSLMRIHWKEALEMKK